MAKDIHIRFEIAFNKLKEAMEKYEFAINQKMIAYLAKERAERERN